MRRRLLTLAVAGFFLATGCASSPSSSEDSKEEGPPPKESAPPPPSIRAKVAAKIAEDEEKDPLVKANRLYTGGDLDGALGVLRDALQTDPDNARARYFFSNFLIEKGELRAAAQELEHTLSLKSRQVLPTIAWNRLGEVRERLGDHQGALDAYVKAIESEREVRERILRDPKKAESVAPPEFAGIVPAGSPEPYRNAARVCLYLGDIESSLKYLEEARARSPRDVMTEYLTVRAYQRLGDDTRMLEAARRFLDLAGDEPLYALRTRELRDLVRSGATPLSKADRALLVDYVRTALRPHLPEEVPERGFFSDHPSERILARDDRAVFVTVIPAEAGAPRFRGRGRGKSLAAAIGGAVSAIKDSARFNPLLARRSAVRIDVEQGQLERVTLTPGQSYAPLGEEIVLEYDATPRVEPGIHGVAVRVDDREVWCLPSDAVFEDLGDVKAMLEFGSREAGLSGRAWEGASSRVFRFRTESFVSAAAGLAPVEVIRGEPAPFPEATAETCADAAVLGGLWLASALELEEKPAPPGRTEKLPTGEIVPVTTLTYARFHYQYKARTGKWDDNSYSEVRHAGAALALVNAFARSGRVELRDAAELSARWLEEHVRIENGRPVILFEGKAKLGTQALALALLDGLATLPGSLPEAPDRAALREGLARTIVAAMNDDGSFQSFLRVQGSFVPQDNDSQFFPGEAILALVRHAKATGEKRWLEAAEKAADARIRWWKSASQEREPLDAWLARALCELDELEGDPARSFGIDSEKQVLRREFAMEMAKAIVKHQCGADRGDAQGGLVEGPMELFPRGMPTASLGEGLAAVAYMARRHGLAGARELREATRLAAAFALRHQYTARNAFSLPSPERAQGSFRSVLTSSRVRIDGVQHNMEFLLLAERLLRD